MDVDNALKIRGQLMKTYEAEWPDSFHRTLKRSVTTMSSNRKAIKVDGTPVYDTELIYTRVIGLQQSRDLDIKDVLSYELSAIPPALFDEHGDMRSQSKAILKHKLQVELYASNQSSRCYHY